MPQQQDSFQPDNLEEQDSFEPDTPTISQPRQPGKFFSSSSGKEFGEAPSLGGRIWDWANRSVLEGSRLDPRGDLTQPSMEEWVRNPVYSAKRATGVALTSPLGFAGELVGGIGLLRGVKGARAAKAAEAGSATKQSSKVAGRILSKDMDYPWMGIETNLSNLPPPKTPVKLLNPGKYYVSPRGKIGNATFRHEGPVTYAAPSMRESLRGQGKIGEVFAGSGRTPQAEANIVQEPIVQRPPTPLRRISNLEEAASKVKTATDEVAARPENVQTGIKLKGNAQRYIDAVKSGKVNPKETSFDKFVQLLKDEEGGVTNPFYFGKRNPSKRELAETPTGISDDPIATTNNEAKLLGIDVAKFPKLEDLQWEITRRTAQETFRTGRNPLTGIGKKLLEGEEGALKLGRKVDPKNVSSIQQQIFDTLITGGQLNLSQIEQRATKLGISKKQFNKIVDEIIETGATSKAATKPEFQGPRQQLLRAIEENRPRREAQEAMYSAERGKRFAAFRGVTTQGEQGFRERMAKLQGEYEKVRNSPLNIPDDDRNALFDMITNNPNLSTGDQIRSGVALGKLLDGSGQVPQRNELEILSKAFGSDFVDNIIELHGGLGALDPGIAKGISFYLRHPKQVFDLSKGIMTGDFPFITSAAFRQGAGRAWSQDWFRSFYESSKSFGSERIFNNVMKIADQSPIWQPQSFIVNGKTVVMSPGEALGLARDTLTKYGKRNEQLGNELAERIPVLGKYIRASNRSFTSFLHTLRTGTAERWLKASGAMDANGVLVDPENAQRIINTVNELTGHGSVSIAYPLTRFGKMGMKERDFNQAAGELADIFWSPRLMARDARMINPMNYIKNDKLARMKYLSGAIRRASVWGAFTGLASLLLGAEVGSDITSSDFGKAKVGNSRQDAGSGLLQFLTLYGRMALGEYTSSTSGKTTEMGSGIGQERFGVASQFLGNKMRPPLSYLVRGAMASENRPFYPVTEAVEQFLPMFTGDLIDLLSTDPEGAQILLGLIGSTVSMGTSTYGDRPEKPAISSGIEALTGFEEEPFEGGRLFGR